MKLLDIIHGFQVQFHWLHEIVCFSCTEQGGKPKANAKKKPAPVSTKRGPSLESVKTLKDGKYIGNQNYSWLFTFDDSLKFFDAPC